MSRQSFVSEFLTFLERREERLLSWGFYGVRQSPQDVEEALQSEASQSLRDQWEEYAEQGESVAELLRSMQRARLLYTVPRTLDAYRTRFGEGVRLMANLRQMFAEKDWATGARLVSDIKIHLAPRIYPRRDRTSSAIWSGLSPLTRPNQELLENCFRALARRNGQEIAFSGFQERAFSHIFSKYGEPGATGSVISAGTGSGKTKAFYIPALLRVATELAAPAFTKVIAVYPRNVLLADQLREAIAEAEKLRPILQERGLRPIRIGALLGSTPHRYWFEPVPQGQRRPSYYWERRGGGHVIPHLKSPVDGQSDLIWRDSDRTADRTALYREGQNQPDIPDGVLALTREQLCANPPDILFVSLEMMNREMGNPQWQRTLGVRQGARAPRLMLLDEVHAYEGVHGAQVAWVLRRWRHWAQAKALHVVGLSATLQDAAEHLTRVVGLSPGQVVELGPTPEEMESEGIEYNLAIKGDPAAGASLLATSIQTGMLLTRLLTPRSQATAAAGQELRTDILYRKKVFGFSDNLDSINRWYSDMSDAEWRRLASLRLPINRRQPAPNPPITPAIAQRMENEGQIWELPTLLGHDLSQPLVVTRCSSQDPGADANSDVIVATSSLEVGFDDPDVGAILHHKRPGSMASFIQRKGRAGRTRGSRPWTVVVLSDYGVDRLAFQSAERLFQPQVESLFLPIANPFVLRIQTALFLVDWIGQRIGLEPGPYRFLSRPRSNWRQAQQRAITLLGDILELGQTWQQFRRDLLRFYQTYSGIKDTEFANSQLDDLLWQEPRPLLTQAIPALLRKLETEWRRAPSDEIEDAGSDRPMPQFIPQATFMDLDVAEAMIEFEAFGGRDRDPQSIPVSKLLTEACPGRISKRFSTARGEPGYWHSFSPSLANGISERSVNELFPQALLLETVGPVRVYQPESVRVIHRATNISDSSNSSWQWNTLGRISGTGTRLPILVESPWRDVFQEADAYLTANGAWLELLRYAQSCRFEIRRAQSTQQTRGTLNLESRNENDVVTPEALGFRLQADGVRFVINPEHLASRARPSDDLVSRCRADYFLYSLQTTPSLRDLLNPFQAEWLAHISVAMLVDFSLRNSVTLQEAQIQLAGNRSTEAVRILDVIFQMKGISPTGQAEDPRLKQTLLDLWREPAIDNELRRLEARLWEPLDADFDAWLRSRYAVTLGEALRSAMCSMTDQVSEDDLVVDVLPVDGTMQVIITEQSSGGLGQVEAIVREIKMKPRRFLDAIEYALTRCPTMDTNTDVLSVLEQAVAQNAAGGPLATAFEGWRTSTNFSDQERAKDAVCGAVNEQGIVPRRSTVVAIASKLLRAGTSPATDGLILDLNRSWAERSATLGIAIPPRSLAFISTSDQAIRDRLNELPTLAGAGAPTDTQLYSQIQQMLFEICRESCPECMMPSNFFNNPCKPARSLAMAWIGLGVDEVAFDSTEWQNRALEFLRRRGKVRIVAPEPQRDALAQGLITILNEELDRDGLFIPITIAQVERQYGLTRVLLQTRDFAND